MIGGRIRIPVLVAGVLILHLTVLSRFHPIGVRPDVLLLLAICAGLAGGAERGAAIGFTIGLLGDLYLETPLGLSALVFAIVGFCVGLIQGGILRAAWWIGPATAFAASAAGVIGFAVAGAMVGLGYLVEPRVALIAAVVATVNALLALPMIRAATWALTDGRPERSYV